MQEVAQTASTIEVINQFMDAFNRHDVPVASWAIERGLR
jgi:hypothetical protein